MARLTCNPYRPAFTDVEHGHARSGHCLVLRFGEYRRVLRWFDNLPEAEQHRAMLDDALKDFIDPIVLEAQ